MEQGPAGASGDTAEIECGDTAADVNDKLTLSGSLRGVLADVAGEALSAGLLWPEVCQEFEKLFIAEALNRSSGCLQVAAELLGLHRNTLRKKVQQYHLDPRCFKG